VRPYLKNTENQIKKTGVLNTCSSGTFPKPPSLGILFAYFVRTFTFCENLDNITDKQGNIHTIFWRKSGNGNLISYLFVLQLWNLILYISKRKSHLNEWQGYRPWNKQHVVSCLFCQTWGHSLSGLALFRSTDLIGILGCSPRSSLPLQEEILSWSNAEAYCASD
jgi:hypothetical protein